MSRLSRTRASRAIVTVVVCGIVGVSVVEYRRTRHPAAATTAGRTAPRAVAVAPKPAGPLVTRTMPNGIPPMLSATTPPPPVTPEPAPATVGGAAVLADARAKAAAGDLVPARKMLNDALLAGGLSDADTAAAKKQLADVNNVLLFSGRPFPSDPLGGTYKVVAGDYLGNIAKARAVPLDLLMQVNRITNPKKLRYGQTLKVINGPFFAVVTKSKFTLDLYLGNPGGPGSTYVESFPVGLGLNNSTPTGTWVIQSKVPHPPYDSPAGRDHQHFDPDDPKNPIGVYWMGLQGTEGDAVGGQSYGIHGTIDPASIGTQSSEGCIRLRNDDVLKLAELLVERKSSVKVVN